MRLLIIVALWLTLTGCNEGRKENTSKNDLGQITLIFKGFPKENSTLRLANQMSINSLFDVGYLDDNLFQERIFFNESKQSDTIRISSKRERVEVNVTFNGVESSSYLFYKGDTAIFNYNNRIPITTVVNRKILDLDINYDIQRRFAIANEDIPTFRKYYMPSFFIKFDYSDKQKLNLYKDSCARIIKTQCLKELRFLDSLKATGLISNDLYSLKKKNLSWTAYLMEKRGGVLNDASMKKLLSDTINYIKSNDTLLYYTYYRNHLYKKVNSHLNKIPIIRKSNGFPIDYCAHFDTICKLSFLSEKARKYFLIEKLRNILDECNSSEIENYQAKFKDITGDTVLLKKIMSKYNIDLSTKNELLLLDTDNNKNNFESVIKKHKGSVIYVDFWASWCTPCRESMPFAQKLRKEYIGKNIVFIYLAYKDQEKTWKEAISKLGLNSNCINYFITNPKTSKTLEVLKLETIPRYMLFDKNGKLINKNAPNPDGELIRKELDKLLNEV
jgi:thiol-disulfide isomerase/thioredoxin